MINICFWNINKKDNRYYLEKLIEENDIDILILIEDNNDYTNIGSLKIAEFSKKSQDIKFYHKDYFEVKCCDDQKKYRSYRINIEASDVYLYGIHLPSNLHNSEETRELALNSLKYDLSLRKNCILCGDFNSNPFDKSIIGTNGLSALPCTKKPKRVIWGNIVYNLYNPMWKFFDDFEKIPGTYYYDSNNAINYYWYLFDQVIFSYSVIDLFDKKSLKIIKKIGNKNLIKNNLIDKSISDHLPVFFSIKGDVLYGKK